MGKFREQDSVKHCGDDEHTEVDSSLSIQLSLLQQQQQLLRLVLPPPPPLQPRPDLVSPSDCDEASGCSMDDQPLDYSMKKLQQQQQRQAQLTGEELLHKIRNTVLLKRDSSQLSISPPSRQQQEKIIQQQVSLIQGGKQHHPPASRQHQLQPQSANQQTVVDADTELRAVYAADCIKSRLEGCGKRVHLFLGILLHFGMPPGLNGEQIFERVIAFSDENKNLTDRPTSYFMVLDSRLLALIWCKFKGNSSNEYSTLTRAIRSTRQKYKGIFEAVENPGKKLYKFGPIAVDQFKQLFPSSYSQQQQPQQQQQAKREAA